MIQISFLSILVVLCLLTVSCDDDNNEGCANYFLKEAKNQEFVDQLYYNDEGLLDVFVQTSPGFPSRRDEYTYNANRQLIRVDYDVYSRYHEFSYNVDGSLGSIREFDTSSGSVARETRYFYSSDGKVSHRNLIEENDTLLYELYEYPSENIMEIQRFTNKNDGTFEENPLMRYTMDDNPKPYPEEYYIAWEAWGNITTPNNVISYQEEKGGVIDPNYSYSYTYNKGGYPTSLMSAISFTYSCDPVKEP